MYSVLIVDDEEPVLESYSYMVRNSELTIEVCGAARSGQEALSLARDTHPDIVVMDIAMPGIDGLETIRELQRAYPETLYILSTAYERFDLAQRAIPLQVFAYLVKPVSRRRFLETLSRAAERLDARREELSHRLEEVQSAADVIEREKREFLLLITWKALDPDEWRRYCRLFQFTSHEGRLVLIRFDQLPETVTREEAIQQLTGRIEKRFAILSTDYLGALLIFISGDSLGLERYLEHSLDALLPRGRITVGFGDLHSYSELYRSYDTAIQRIDGLAGEPNSRDDNGDSLSAVRHAVARSADPDRVYARCKAWWSGEFNRVPFPLARSRMIALFTLMMDDAARCAGGDHREELRVMIGEPADVITGIESIAEWEAWAGRALRLIVERCRGHKRDNLPPVLRRAVAYVDDHYSEDVHLSGLAELCRVSASHLSRLFSEHLHTTFNDYLNRARIEAAERHLREGRMSIKEVAYATGYKDPNYFSRIFRKHTGFSPSSYSMRKEIHE